jgi:hypothetical protein
VGCENYQDESPGSVLGATVSTSGQPSEIFTISPFSIAQYNPFPAAANGPGTQILVVFPDWADNINGNPANAIRIWGKIRHAAGIEENDYITSDNGKFDLTVQPAVTQGICQLAFVHSAPTPLKLKLFNNAGILLNERIVGNSAGQYDLNIDISDLPNGTYFINLSSDNISESQKVVLIK